MKLAIFKIIYPLCILLMAGKLYGASATSPENAELDSLEEIEFEGQGDVKQVNGNTKKKTPPSDEVDLNLNEIEANAKGGSEIKSSEIEELDDLQSLKEDIGEDSVVQELTEGHRGAKSFVPAKSNISEEEKKKKTGNLDLKVKPKDEKVNSEKIDIDKIITEDVLAQEEKAGPIIFDVGEEEKKLLNISKFVENKIPDKEWSDISAQSRLDKYVVQEGDWLWKISKTLFGSGFYYSKIWSLNPYILNPHEIEPGMVLTFDTGTADSLPNIQLGSFEENGPTKKSIGHVDVGGAKIDLMEFGDDVEPAWLGERKKLIDQGVYFQFASEETYDDLAGIGAKSLNNEYEKYEPPVANIIIHEPGEQYDSGGFDKDSKIIFNFKEGFFLNTFITTNIVQDFGEIEAASKESVFLHKLDLIYVKLDNSVKAKPGDMYSVYTAEGKVSHASSDRSGYRYTIVAQIKTVKKINNLWECQITEISGLVQRGDRITTYTPKIDRIAKTFNKRNIEASLIDSYRDTANGLSFGDVIYIDRGRADGVELGNIFEFYSFIDRGTDKRITPDPTYKIGELVVITLSDNFSTALISNSSSQIGLGALALSKTSEQAARTSRIKNHNMLNQVRGMETEALDELDVELNLDDVSEDLLKKADQVKITEDELEELERQEREKSVIKEHERDVGELDKLESEIVTAEKSLNEAKIDEDKYLEQQNLNDVESKTKKPDANAFESLNEIEKEIGLKYMDEDINNRENPYGLTEFDLEEIDELLNTETK